MRRRFQPKANIPMVADTHRRLALELRTSAETLIERPSVEAYNQMSKIFAALARAGMAGDAINLATDAMSDICDRYERVGKVGVNEIEAEHLRIAVNRIDGRLALVPLNRLEDAIAMVEVFCAFAGV